MFVDLKVCSLQTNQRKYLGSLYFCQFKQIRYNYSYIIIVSLGLCLHLPLSQVSVIIQSYKVMIGTTCVDLIIHLWLLRKLNIILRMKKVIDFCEIITYFCLDYNYFTSYDTRSLLTCTWRIIPEPPTSCLS